MDEARIKEAEVERQIRFREIDFEEKLRESKEKRTLLKIKLSIALGIIGAIFMMIGFVGGELTGNPDSSIYMFSFLDLFSIMAVAFIWLGDTSDKNK